MIRSLATVTLLAGMITAPMGCETTTDREGNNESDQYMAAMQDQTQTRARAGQSGDSGASGSAMDVQQAVAVLQPTEGNNAEGTVMFETTGEGEVTVTAEITGLEPNSAHGFHIHEYGDITAEDGTSAGGHYNPEDHPHALPMEQPRHAGDLGNIEADENGEVDFEITVDNISITGQTSPVLGRGMIVHQQRDTGEQPTGEAGNRIAMGVIGVANTE